MSSPQVATEDNASREHLYARLAFSLVPHRFRQPIRTVGGVEG
jgi:hypothetical protein